jgi:hypothetical protein
MTRRTRAVAAHVGGVRMRSVAGSHRDLLALMMRSDARACSNQDRRDAATVETPHR